MPPSVPPRNAPPPPPPHKPQHWVSHTPSITSPNTLTLPPTTLVTISPTTRHQLPSYSLVIPSSPHHTGIVALTPVSVHTLSLLLATHPNRAWVEYLLRGLTFGFSTDYLGSPARQEHPIARSGSLGPQVDIPPSALPRAVVDCIQSGTSRCPHIMHLLRTLLLIATQQHSPYLHNRSLVSTIPWLNLSPDSTCRHSKDLHQMQPSA